MSTIKQEFVLEPDEEEMEFRSNFDDVQSIHSEDFNDAADGSGSSDETMLKALLHNFQMECLLPFLKAADITYRSLRYLNENDINEVIRSVGHRAEFREKLFAWRRKKYTTEEVNPIVCHQNDFDLSACQESNKRGRKRPASSVSANMDTDTEQESSTQQGTITRTGATLQIRPKQKINLGHLLEQTYQGVAIKDFYAKNGCLKSSHRDEIISIIVNHVIANNIKLGCNDFQPLADMIVEAFPNEEDARQYYFQRRRPKRNPIGRLYSKYYNSVKKRRVQDERGDNSNKSNENLTAEGPDAVDANPSTDDPSVKAIKSFLRCDGIVWEDVITMWSKTYAARQQDLRICSTKDFLEDWPKYLMPKGIELFDIDFNCKYPNKSDVLRKKWPEFKTKIYGYYMINIKDESCKGIFALCGTRMGKAVEEYLLTILLTAILPPSARFRDSSGCNRRKVSIADAVDWLALRVPSLDQLQARRDELKQKYGGSEAAIEMKPNIVVVGESNVEINEIYVNFDKTFYKMPDILTAIDACMKIFRVLNIEYPSTCQYVWVFIQRYFYEISTSMDTTVPALISLLTYLKF